MARLLHPLRSVTRSRVGKWILRGVLAVAIVLGLAAVASGLLVKHVSDTIESNLTRDTDVVQALTPTTSPKSVDTGGTPDEPAQTFLIIGSDSREGVTDALGTNFGDFPGQRADVIMLVKVYPSEDRVQVLSIPRDLEVDIDGHGTNKINAAFSFGGSELMVRTVRQVTGLDINHYIEVNFVGFADIVDELGGVVLNFPYPARDLKSGFEIDAGTQRLDGAQALAYVRSRHYQEYRDGEWVSVDASDIGRMRRQQQIILAVLAEMKRPATLTDASGLVQTIASSLTVDSLLGQRTMLDLAWSLRSIDAAAIDAATLPTYGKMIDDRSYQLPKEPQATQVLAAFSSGDPLEAAADGPIRIQILNGNGVAGSAAATADKLDSSEFDIVDVSDADSSDFASTVIIARPDRLALARAVQTSLGFGDVTPGSVPNGVDAIVIVGRDAPAA
jgi:LCP family protein required for cell wall assembly